MFDTTGFKSHSGLNFSCLTCFYLRIRSIHYIICYFFVLRITDNYVCALWPRKAKLILGSKALYCKSLRTLTESAIYFIPVLTRHAHQSPVRFLKCPSPFCASVDKHAVHYCKMRRNSPTHAAVLLGWNASTRDKASSGVLREYSFSTPCNVPSSFVFNGAFPILTQLSYTLRQNSIQMNQ